MPESFELAAVRDARALRSARRREVVTMLRVAESVSAYAAGQVSDGLSPAEAQCAALQAAESLAEIVVQLQRLARLGPSERRDLALELAGLGIPRREIAVRLGVSLGAVRHYLRRRSPGG